jgi:hypothetical protein
MQALFPADAPTPYPGPGHRHPGPEAWFLVSGAQCLETPNGLIVASAGGGAMVPDGWPMAIASVGEETRRALVLILHRSSELKRTGFLGDLISWEDGVYGTSKSVFAGGA